MTGNKADLIIKQYVQCVTCAAKKAKTVNGMESTMSIFEIVDAKQELLAVEIVVFVKTARKNFGYLF